MTAQGIPRGVAVAAILLALGGAAAVQGQSRTASGQSAAAAPGTASTGPATRGATTQPAASTPKPEELEQVVAPIALYPDSLLAQVLMASTYPLEIVQADRWLKENSKLKDSADALNKLTWDPSVKSLIAFPQVLTMMSEKLDWTVKLGDAFLADQKGVMDAIQRLRGKAYAKGNLQTTKEQTVKVEQPPAGAGTSSQVIVVESANPSVTYVPTYNPTVVYGGWPYPSYPPYSYYPPGYTAAASMVSFGVGVAVGAAWGHAWGNCNWHGGDVDIDVDKNYNFNQNIDRNKYKNEINNRNAASGNRAANTGRTSWQHDASHRKGVAYRDTATSERFRGSGSGQSAQSRDAYRGRAEAGRQDLSRGGANASRGSASGRTQSGGYRTSTSGGGASGRDYSGTRSSGFTGADSGSASARSASSRGQSSRSSSYSSSRSGGGYSGGSRGYSGGGGGARGGGGGGRGGGGGGRR